MTNIKYYLIVLFLFIVGCNDNNVSSNNGLIVRRSTLSSKVINSQGVGFSFAKGDTVIISNSSNIKADISTLVQTNDTGKVLGVFLSAIPYRKAFRLMYESSVTDSAKIYFENLKEFSDSIYSELAIPVRTNQIWLIKTHDEKYAKIVIINTLAYADNTVPSSPTLYGELTFDWIYQPSGERKF